MWQAANALHDRLYKIHWVLREDGLIRLPDSLDLFVNYGHSAAAFDTVKMLIVLLGYDHGIGSMPRTRRMPGMNDGFTHADRSTRPVDC